jgi:phosphatidate cytidylyltransferase
MASSDLAKRVAVAAVGVPIAIGAVYVGGWVLAILLMLIGVLAALEFYRLAERRGAMPLHAMGAVLSAAFILAVAAAQQGFELVAWGTLTAIAFLALATTAIWTNGVNGEPLVSVSVTLTGALYTGGLLCFGYLLRHMPGVQDPLHGTALLFAPVLLTWSSDTFAYLVGRQWGTRKLIPKVSPGKTVQGAVGALVGTVVVAVLYMRVLAGFPDYHMTLPQAVLFGALMSVAAQVGDLAESLFKRNAGVKDSGTLLPGHGGALDRFDSLFFTLPVAYFFIRYWTAGT